MKKCIRAVLASGVIVGLIATGTPKLAHASGTCVSTSCTAHIIEFAVMANRVRIRLDVDANQLAKLTNCTLETGVYFTLSSAHGLYKEALMTLRSAQLAEREVTIRTVDGSADCTVSYVRSY